MMTQDEIIEIEQPTPSQSAVDETAEFKRYNKNRYPRSLFGHEFEIAIDAWKARAQLSNPQPTSQDVVKIPKSVDEAKAMAIISTNYLKQFAPNELYPPKESKQ